MDIEVRMQNVNINIFQADFNGNFPKMDVFKFQILSPPKFLLNLYEWINTSVQMVFPHHSKNRDGISAHSVRKPLRFAPRFSVMF